MPAPASIIMEDDPAALHGHHGHQLLVQVSASSSSAAATEGGQQQQRGEKMFDDEEGQVEKPEAAPPVLEEAGVDGNDNGGIIFASGPSPPSVVPQGSAGIADPAVVVDADGPIEDGGGRDYSPERPDPAGGQQPEQPQPPPPERPVPVVVIGANEPIEDGDDEAAVASGARAISAASAPALSPPEEAHPHDPQQEQPPPEQPQEQPQSEQTRPPNKTKKNRRKNQQQQQRHVNFSTVQIRSYSQTVGDNPCCSYGVPISLDWEYTSADPLPLSEFESAHDSRKRSRRDMLLSYYQRRDALLLAGHTMEELTAAEREVRRERFRRSLTLNLLPVFLAQEKVVLGMDGISTEISKKRKSSGSSHDGSGSGSGSGSKSSSSHDDECNDWASSIPSSGASIVDPELGTCGVAKKKSALRRLSRRISDGSIASVGGSIGGIGRRSSGGARRLSANARKLSMEISLHSHLSFDSSNHRRRRSDEEELEEEMERLRSDSIKEGEFDDNNGAGGAATGAGSNQEGGGGGTTQQGSRDPYVPSHDSAFSRYAIRTDPTQHDRATEIRLCSLARPHMRSFHASWFSFFVAFFVWFAITPLLSEVQATLNLTKEEVWTSSLCGTAGTILMRIVMGPACDKFGARVCMAFILMASAIPCALTGLVQTSQGLSAVRSFVGIAGSSFVACQYWTSSMFTREVAGTANALVAGWGNLGGGVTQLVMGSVLFPIFKAIYGGDDDESREKAWRTVFVVPALLAVCAALLILRWCDDSPKGDYRERVRQQEIAIASPCDSFTSAVTNWNVWALALQYAACFGVEVTMTNATALYFKERFGQSTESAAAIASIFGFMNLFARGLGGLGSDVLNARRGMRGRLTWQFVTLLLQGASIVVFAFAGTLPGAIFALIFASIMVQSAEGSTFGIVPYVSRRYTGGVVGFVGAGGNVGGVIFAALFVRFKYHKAFYLMGATAALSSLLSFTVRIKRQNSFVGCDMGKRCLYACSSRLKR